MTSYSLKILAYLVMFSDHIGKLFFPSINIFKIFGRMAFPLFAFLLAEGFTQTKNKTSYLKRLFVWGVISQAPYMFFLKLLGYANFYRLNILFTLLFGLLILILFENKKYIGLFVFSVSLIFVDAIIGFDYGVYGILLIIFSYVFTKNKIIGSILIISTTLIESFDFNFGKGFSLQVFAVLSIVPIVFYNKKLGPKINKYWFYIIYPVHFLILIGIWYLLN